MTLRAIVSAAPILQKIMTQDLPLKISYGIFRIINAANVELVFFREKYGEVIKAGYSDEDLEREVEKILDLEVEWKCGCVDIPIDTNLNISPDDLGIIDGFIKIIE